jgi:hypothetical protein
VIVGGDPVAEVEAWESAALVLVLHLAYQRAGGTSGGRVHVTESALIAVAIGVRVVAVVMVVSLIVVHIMLQVEKLEICFAAAVPGSVRAAEVAAHVQLRMQDTSGFWVGVAAGAGAHGVGGVGVCGFSDGDCNARGMRPRRGTGLRPECGRRNAWRVWTCCCHGTV